MNSDLYKNIGILFYAIAKADNNLALEEYRKLNDILDSSWSHVHPKLIEQTKGAFNESYLNKLESSDCFDAFIAYYNNDPDLFSKELKQLILKTANGIAYAFAKINKSELILIAKLSIEFKK
jgi:hypothetical protein